MLVGGAYRNSIHEEKERTKAGAWKSEIMPKQWQRRSTKWPRK
jgi:hypothetical protein